MSDFLAAIGLVLILEGAFYALFPTQAIAMLKQIMLVSPDRLRMAGVVAAAVGFVVLWGVRG